MSHLLDTSTCNHFLNDSSPRVGERIVAVGPGRLAISSLTLAELLFRAARSDRPEANRARLETFAGEIRTVPFDDRCGEHFAGGLDLGLRSEALIRVSSIGFQRGHRPDPGLGSRGFGSLLSAALRSATARRRRCCEDPGRR